jgi:hypothetical protein
MRRQPTKHPDLMKRAKFKYQHTLATLLGLLRLDASAGTYTFEFRSTPLEFAHISWKH